MPHQYGISARAGTEAVRRFALPPKHAHAPPSSQLMLSARLTMSRVARCSGRSLLDASSTRSFPSLGSAILLRASTHGAMATGARMR